MSRLGRGRGGNVALPLDSNLFRENSNCPSAARSAGTVGKWGITSFTSIRSGSYGFTNIVKKPVQDQNHPLTVAPLETEAPPPKPKKFFKSRNVPDVPAAMPEPVFAPPAQAHSRSPSPEYLPSSSKRRAAKKGRSPVGARDISPEPVRKTKSKPATKAARKEDPTETTHLSPNKRYLVRNRDKVINYAEDRSNSPIPSLQKPYVAPVSTPEHVPAPILPELTPVAPVEVPVPQPSPTVSSPSYVKPGLISPSSKDGKPPPIVLRISKGTSRIVSTDSNEGLTSPGSDRHSDTHLDLDPKMSPAVDMIRSPKQEGLKITIKCPILKDSKKKEKKDRNEEKEGRTRVHKRNHHRSSDDELLIGEKEVRVRSHKRNHHTFSDDEPLMDSKPTEQREAGRRSHKRIHQKSSDDEPLIEPKLTEEKEGGRRFHKRNHHRFSDDEPLVESKLTEEKDAGRRSHKRNHHTFSDDEPLTESKPTEEKEAGRHSRKKTHLKSSDEEPLIESKPIEQKEGGRRPHKWSHRKSSDDEPLVESKPTEENEGHSQSYKRIQNKSLDDEPLIEFKPTETKEGWTRSHKRTQHKSSDDEPLIESKHTEEKERRTRSYKRTHLKASDDEPLIEFKPIEEKEGRTRAHKRNHQKSLDDQPLIESNSVEEKEQRTRAHKRNNRKSSDDEPLIKKVVASPQPGTENYDLYQTLASPARVEPEPTEILLTDKKEKSYEEIESQLAMLDSEEPKNSLASLQNATELLPEPKPPEKMAGRAMRSRATINYSENDDGLIEDLTSGRTLARNIPKPPKKSRRRAEALIAEIVAAQAERDAAAAAAAAAGKVSAAPVDESDLISILSGANVSERPESEHIKIRINKKHNQLIQNDHPTPEENNFNDISPPHNNTTSLARAVFRSPRNVDMSGEEKPSVKLVITKKKGSIFKSKSLVNDSDNSALPARKRRHLYTHQWDDDGKGNQTPRHEPEQASENSITSAPPQVDELTRVTKYHQPEPTLRLPHEGDEEILPYTSVKCPKGAKEYYTVVRNVKKAHQIQEIGEFQEFNDDVEYILDALQDNNPMSTRCLSAITLASKCTAPAFRMHVRAHGTVQKFFSALHDATNDQSLGLCTATVMFVLSQDRLNMDLDRESLELMLNLLESDVSHRNALDDCGLTSSQLAKNKERVRELCAEIKSQGKAKHLDLDNITVGHLAMETLLSLTSKRAGEWFKEELRALGGVDHIVRTIRDCTAHLQRAAADTHVQWSTGSVDVLRKADRCMRVLENVTQQNEENQLYLVSDRGPGSEGYVVARTLASLLQLCVTQARCSPPQPSHLQVALLDAALPAVKVLVNLSHNFTAESTLGAQVVGQDVSVMENCLILLHNEGNFVPENKNFEFCVCVLLLLINLVQNQCASALRLLDVRVPTSEGLRPALHLLLDHLYAREELARMAEKNTDEILDGGEKKEDDKNKQDDVDETVAKLLARAGVHMEHCMVAAYVALLLGHVACISPELDERVRRSVRGGDYRLMVQVLSKYAAFVDLTASAEAASVAHIKSTKKIIAFLQESDARNAAPPAHYRAPSPGPAFDRSYYADDQPQDLSAPAMH